MKNLNKKLLLCTIMSIVSSMSYSSEWIASWWKPKAQPKPVYRIFTPAEIEAIERQSNREYPRRVLASILKYPTLGFAAMPAHLDYVYKQAQINAQNSATKTYNIFENSAILFAQGTKGLVLQTAAKTQNQAHEIAEDAYQRASTRIQETQFRIIDTAQRRVDKTVDKTANKIEDCKSWARQLPQRATDTVRDSAKEAKFRIKHQARKTADEAANRIKDALFFWRSKK